MKKSIALLVTGLVVLSTGVVSFADSSTSPAEIYAQTAGITLEEAFDQRGTDQTFGDLAKEKGIWDQFSQLFLSSKTESIQAKVDDGTMTSEDADRILTQLENCDGTGTDKLLSGYNMQFGKGNGTGNQGNGFGAKSGNGLRDGSGAGNGQRNGNGNGLKDGSGNGRWNN